jgi:superfamily II DNA/RNA helicase
MDKPEIVARILQAHGRGLAMVFCQTKRQCDRLSADLIERGFAAAAVHGDLGQGQREQALRAFRAGKIDVLVATDVAARGIDVEGVTHVINYSCPDDEKTYLHRIGRTGRAGASGVAITLVDWDDLARWKSINTILDLPFPDPPETYSTSDALYDELNIDRAVRGVLPRADRTRSGLASEVLEDIGGRPPGGRAAGRDSRGHDGGRGGSGAKSGSRSGGARNGGSTRSSAPRTAAAEPATGGDQPEKTGAPRARRRTRGAAPAAEGSASTTEAPAPDNSAESAAGRPRRRRSRGGRGGGTHNGANSGANSGASAGDGAESTAPAE